MTVGLIAIVESQPVARLGLETALRSAGLNAKSFSPSQTAVAVLLNGQLTGRPPDVLIVDRRALRMVDSLAAECRAAHPPPRLVLFDEDHPPLPWVIRRVERDADLKELLAAVAADRTGPMQSAVDLTQRETEVLTLAAEGLPSAAIANRLFISSGTVKLHLHHAYRKLGVRNRAAAVYAALHAGLIGAPGQVTSIAPPRIH